MLIVPEIQTVVILTPRTGSGSLRRALAAAYPQAMQIYRHMEADGVPPGYDRWRRIGIVREPVARLWSLYKFLRTFDGDHDRAYIAAQRRSVDCPFCDWLVDNQTVFTSPYDSAGLGRFFPGFTVRHPLPETRKSQFLYLRPDLGTQVFAYRDLAAVAERLGVALGRVNDTPGSPPPELTPAARDHVCRFFMWDLAVSPWWVNDLERRRRA